MGKRNGRGLDNLAVIAGDIDLDALTPRPDIASEQLRATCRTGIHLQVRAKDSPTVYPPGQSRPETDARRSLAPQYAQMAGRAWGEAYTVVGTLIAFRWAPIAGAVVDRGISTYVASPVVYP